PRGLNQCLNYPESPRGLIFLHLLLGEHGEYEWFYARRFPARSRWRPFHNGFVILCGLVALGRIGIKIVLALKHGALVDVGAYGKPKADGLLYGGSVYTR